MLYPPKKSKVFSLDNFHRDRRSGHEAAAGVDAHSLSALASMLNEIEALLTRDNDQKLQLAAAYRGCWAARRIANFPRLKKPGRCWQKLQNDFRFLSYGDGCLIYVD